MALTTIRLQVIYSSLKKTASGRHLWKSESKDSNITVYHTEVSEKLKGKGVGMALIAALVDYARKNKLKVIACAVRKRAI